MILSKFLKVVHSQEWIKTIIRTDTARWFNIWSRFLKVVQSGMDEIIIRTDTV